MNNEDGRLTMRVAVLGAGLLVAVPFLGASAQDITNHPLSAVPPAGASHSAVENDNGTKSTSTRTNPSESKEGYKHNTGDVANGPTPPRQTGTAPASSPQTGAASDVQRVQPGPSARANSGTRNAGNSSQGSGNLGSESTTATATMQSGHVANH
jgi:hypothetical protein